MLVMQQFMIQGRRKRSWLSGSNESASFVNNRTAAASGALNSTTDESSEEIVPDDYIQLATKTSIAGIEKFDYYWD